MRILIILLFAGLPAMPMAQGGNVPLENDIAADSDYARAAVARGEILPLSVLLPRLALAYPGKVLDIEIDLYPDGRFEEYEFEVLTPDGRLIEVDMDAVTGKITEVEDDDHDDGND